MNCFAVALQRAVALAQSRRELETEFNRALHDLQFAPDSECVVLGVSFEDALLWANGELSDLDLVLRMNGEKTAVWWPILPNLKQYASGIRAAKRLIKDGARLMIGHTHNPVVLEKFLKHGSRVTHRGVNGGQRILAPTEALNDWLKF